MEKIEVIKSGIDGLDKMLNGGIPKNNSVLIAGGPGTGKTSLCLEFLYRGALDGEKTVFISLEEEKKHILAYLGSVFTQLKKLEEHVEKGNIKIIKTKKNDIPSIINIIRKEVSNKKASRLVIDSGTLLKLFYKSEIEFRKSLFGLIQELKKAECTTFITNELESAERSQVRFDVEHFLVDGVVNLYNLEIKNKRINAMEVMKMRAADHKKNVVPMKITSSGMKIFPKESIF